MGGKTNWLKSCRVIDLTTDLGSLCGRILADMGADVIKIEKPSGSPERRMGPFFKDIIRPEQSLQWFAFNAGKKGITLNIETSDGKNIIRKLVQSADILIESFSPGNMDSLGLGYKELNKLNPRLIYTSITLFGQDGPYQNYSGSDIVLMALSGLLYINGDSDRPPLRFSVDQVSCHAGLQAAAGTLLAYYHARRTGIGQRVDCSAHEALLVTLFDVVPSWDLNHFIIKRQGDRAMRAKIAQKVLFPCKDGQVSWRFLTGARGGRTKELVNWMAEENMAGDLINIDWETISFDDISQDQASKWEQVFGSFFGTKTRDELYSEGKYRGIMIYPVNNLADVYCSAQLESRGFWQKVEHEAFGEEIMYPGLPINTLDVCNEKICRAPNLGEHNLQVYKDELGMSIKDIIILKQSGII